MVDTLPIVKINRFSALFQLRFSGRTRMQENVNFPKNVSLIWIWDQEAHYCY